MDDDAGIPVIHLTDLYQPAQDPDDTVDLATLHALPELDIRAVVLDPTRRFLRPAWAGGADVHRELGVIPVLQMQQITGRSYPVAAGPADPLTGPDDDCTDRPAAEQAGVDLLLRELRRSPAPVTVSVVSSLRPLAAAYNRDPGLCHEKIGRVLVNAGNSVHGAEVEWNIALDPHASVTVWRSGLPIDWFPCTGAGGSFAVEENNTYWAADHPTLLTGLPGPLAAWFHYSFSGSNRADIFRALAELGAGEPWRLLLHGSRNMWSTASLVTAAGRVPVRTDQGWRFLRATGPAADTPAFDLCPVRVDVTDEGVTTWRPERGAPHRIFTRRTDLDHCRLMTQALRALFDDTHWDTPLY